MKSYLAAMILFASCLVASAQSKTTEDLSKKFPNATTAFFYHNTLRMLNQSEDKAFDELIKDVEKMKFIYLDKTVISSQDYDKLKKSYFNEKFELIMNSRSDGKTFDVFLKEEKGATKGMVIAVNSGGSFFVMDIVGSVALNKIPSFFKTVDQSEQITNLISNFTKKQ